MGGAPISETLPSSNGTYGFIGVTSTTPFARVIIADQSTDGGGAFNLASIQFGTAAAISTPEPSTIALAACGIPALLVAGYRHYRRRRIA